jgi:hypothetical protein
VLFLDGHIDIITIETLTTDWTSVPRLQTT